MVALSEHYGVSRKTLYKWLARYQEHGTAGWAERSRAPPHSPQGIREEVREAIVIRSPLPMRTAAIGCAAKSCPTPIPCRQPPPESSRSGFTPLSRSTITSACTKA